MGLALITSAPAAACACCAERGDWLEISRSIPEFELADLNRVRLSHVAHLKSTPRGEFPGLLHPPPSLRYSVTQTRTGRRWNLTFRDRRRAGTLSLAIPRRVVDFQVDLRDGRTHPGGGPSLYKEYRLEGSVSGTGVFAPGMRGRPRFRLILHGRGNHCMNADDFKRWTLEISGPGAEYTLYGSLQRPR